MSQALRIFPQTSRGSIPENTSCAAPRTHCSFPQRAMSYGIDLRNSAGLCRKMQGLALQHSAHPAELHRPPLRLSASPPAAFCMYLYRKTQRDCGKPQGGYKAPQVSCRKPLNLLILCRKCKSCHSAMGRFDSLLQLTCGAKQPPCSFPQTICSFL